MKVLIADANGHTIFIADTNSKTGLDKTIPVDHEGVELK